MTNGKFAVENEEFRAACGNIPWKDPKDENRKTLPPTKRQASKWRMGKGLAWTKGKQ